MRGSFRDTPKILFCMGRVKTIDKFIACSFDTFHCAPFLNCSEFPNANDALDSRVACGACIAVLRQLWGKNNSKVPCQNRQRNAVTTPAFLISKL